MADIFTKRPLKLVAAMLLAGGLFLVFHHFEQMTVSFSVQPSFIILNTTKPIILNWVPTYHKRSWVLPETELCGNGCIISDDKSLEKQSDAFVFYMKGTNANTMPDQSSRRQEQLYVWWAHESPHTIKTYWGKTLNELPAHFFNLTQHYRSDSDIIGAFIPHTARDWFLHKVGRGNESTVKKLAPVTNRTQFNSMFAELMGNKTKNAMWLISDCDFVKDASTRLKFGRRIQNDGNFDVDIFGKCGTKELPLSNHAVFDMIRTYKFYFAFENTVHCMDYVTEKFWYNSLYAGAVPVVWGPDRSSVERLAPPGSFIHAQDFNNDPVKLAAYLKELASDDNAYKEYFKWWMMPGFYPIYKLRPPTNPRDIVLDDVFDYEISGYCHLCRLLHDKKYNGQHKSIESLSEAFFGREGDQCLGN